MNRVVGENGGVPRGAHLRSVAELLVHLSRVCNVRMAGQEQPHPLSALEVEAMVCCYHILTVQAHQHAAMLGKMDELLKILKGVGVEPGAAEPCSVSGVQSPAAEDAEQGGE